MMPPYRATQRATEQAFSRDNATLCSLVRDASLIETRELQVVLAALLTHPADATVTLSDVGQTSVALTRWLELQCGLPAHTVAVDVRSCVSVCVCASLS